MEDDPRLMLTTTLPKSLLDRAREIAGREGAPLNRLLEAGLRTELRKRERGATAP